MIIEICDPKFLIFNSICDLLNNHFKMPQFHNGFILEVQRYIRDERTGANGIFEHVGYVNRIFKTKPNAAEYYDILFPEMRGLNVLLTWNSDWHPETRLRYVVREYYGEVLSIAA